MLWADDVLGGGMPWWGVVLTAVGAGVSVFVAAFFTGLKELLMKLVARIGRRIDGHDDFDPVAMLTMLSEFNVLLNESRKLPNVGRVLVFVGHNCGGLPEAGKPYTVRSHTGWSINDADAAKYTTFAFDFEVDEPYRQILSDANRTGVVSLVTKAMPAGMLRTIYETEGVVHALLYSLRLDSKRNKFAYATVASYAAEFSQSERALIDLFVYRMRSLLFSRS